MVFLENKKVSISFMFHSRLRETSTVGLDAWKYSFYFWGTIWNARDQIYVRQVPYL